MALYNSTLKYIDGTSCGAVYPKSITELNQSGDIYIDNDSILFWHYSGFAFVYGACNHHFLECIYHKFLSNDSNLSRKFILFATNLKLEKFFQEKENLLFGKRYFFEYPQEYAVPSQTMPYGYHICEFNQELLDSVQGRITPYFSWKNASEFLNHGKGYCIMHEENPVAWAFSAAVSSDEIDIGIEVSSNYQHSGLGTLIAEKMISYCFEQHKHPVWACDSNNIASQKLALKLGFEKVSECTTIKLHYNK